MFIKLFVVPILLFISSVHGSDILFYSALATKSYVGFAGAIVKLLAERGHSVTFVTPYNVPNHENITQLKVEPLLENYFPSPFEEVEGLYPQTSDFPKGCSHHLLDQRIQSLDVDGFDLIIVTALCNDNDCFFGRLEHSKVPVILTSPVALTPYLHDVMGNVNFPSFMTGLSHSDVFPLSFLQRAKNLLTVISETYSVEWEYLPMFESECIKSGVCAKNMRSIKELTSRASLLFLNSIRSLEYPVTPSMPNVIHVGGITCRPSESLPPEFEKWIEGAGIHGFIFVSFGTSAKSSLIPKRFMDVILRVLGSLDQRVILKWSDDDTLQLPKNVMQTAWAPQQDLLGHKSIKFFVTQGGIYSLQESSYHGVPVLGMPFKFFDQINNVKSAVREGWAQFVDWETMTDDILYHKIRLLLENKSYKEVAQKRSQLMKDQVVPPSELIIYWSEYVMRHNGAPHLRSPLLDIAWYQLYNTDVWGLFLAMTIAVLYLFLFIFKRVFSVLFQFITMLNSKIIHHDKND